MKVHLDRVVANSAFINMHDFGVVENVITTSSDHYVILPAF